MLIIFDATCFDEKDEQLFEQFVQKYSNMMMSTAFKVLKDHHLSEDAVYTVFWNVSKNFGNFKCIPDVKKGAYLRNSTYNEAVRYAKRYRIIYNHEVYGEELDIPTEDYRDPVFEAISEKADMEIALEVLRDLDLKHRVILSMVFYEEKKLVEIAEELDCSIGTVKSRFSRARAKFISEYRRRICNQ